MTAWVVRLPRESIDQTAALWNVDGVEVCAVGDAVWLRGPMLDEARETIVRRFPGADRFTVVGQSDLVAAGSIVPSAVVPKGPWQAYRRAVHVVFPAASFPTAAAKVRTSPANRASIRLERAATYVAPTAIVTNAADFLGYANGVSQIRLKRWTFAVSESNRVLVRGTPLPAVPGEQFVEFSGLLIPAGGQWIPAVDARTLRRALGINETDLALFDSNGTWRRIAAESLVAATRSAVRISLTRELHTG
jgi:hypothetical protein